GSLRSNPPKPSKLSKLSQPSQPSQPSQLSQLSQPSQLSRRAKRATNRQPASPIPIPSRRDRLMIRAPLRRAEARRYFMYRGYATAFAFDHAVRDRRIV